LRRVPKQQRLVKFADEIRRGAPKDAPFEKLHLLRFEQ
jgi:hypothetical protein